ncbi:DUF5313 domain-containing protein [Kibdelosporangium philippinense]|uniref:DUF5313 domain-containing protein n=1 Tax=Kibdelosporangium philippinense TaxID=211113 RepID=A0ABS8ZG29_9PSEU|nr:DUF5313 family protein [Kibdelosporangium philippinense]MCE7006781.1 DUF5313 domain-containing protein [Kibdelosporangium philippinense]
MSVKRPNPALWLWYAVGGKLPDRYREWVLHDATVPTWLIRHVLRRLVFMAPILAALYLVLAVMMDFDLMIVLVGLGLGVYAGLYYSLVFSTHSVDSRVTRHGYPDEYASQVRKAMKQVERERYNARWRDDGATSP